MLDHAAWLAIHACSTFVSIYYLLIILCGSFCVGRGRNLTWLCAHCPAWAACTAFVEWAASPHARCVQDEAAWTLPRLTHAHLPKLGHIHRSCCPCREQYEWSAAQAPPCTVGYLTEETLVHAAAEGADLQSDSLSATIRRHSQGLASAEQGSSNAVKVPAVQPARAMVAAAGGAANPRRSTWRGPGSMVPQQLGPVEVSAACLTWMWYILHVLGMRSSHLIMYMAFAISLKP